MKNILHLIIATTLLAGLTVSALAQEAGPRRGQGAQAGAGAGQRGQMGRLGEVQKKVLAQLDLTTDQKSKIAALDKKTKEEAMKLMQGGRTPETREQMQDLTKKHREAMLKILTPAQRTKFQELMKAEMKKIREQAGNRKGGGAAPRP